MKESRRFERFCINVPCQIELLQSRRKRKVIKTYISNLSELGAFIPDLKSLFVGQRFKADIFFFLEGTNPFCKEEYELIAMAVYGSVIRSGPSGTAITFNDDYRLSSRRIVNDQVTIKNVDERYAADGIIKLYRANGK